MSSKAKISYEDRLDSLYDSLLVVAGWIVDPPVRLLLRRMHTSQEIAKNVSITTEWQEFRPKKPMKINRRFQEVYLKIDGCLAGKRALILKGGTTINPDLRIEDDRGNSYQLHLGRRTLGEVDLVTNLRRATKTGFRGDLPRDRKYVSLSIRSEKPFQCSSIAWHNYNLK